MKRLLTLLAALFIIWQAYGQEISAKYSFERVTDAFTDADVDFSPDGNLLAFGTKDGKVHIYELKSGTLYKTLDAGMEFIISVAFSPDGKKIASGDKQGFIRAWEVETGKELFAIEAHKKAILAVRFSPDGTLLFSGSRDNYVKLWNPESGLLVKTMEKSPNNIRAIVFSPDGKYIICATSALLKGVQYYDLETGTIAKVLEAANVQYIAISPDESQLACASLNKNIVMWDLEKFQYTDYPGHSAFIKGCAFSPGGKILVTCSDDKTVRLWNMPARQCVYALNGHTSNVIFVAYSPRGGMVASSSWDGTIKVWDISSLNLPKENLYEKPDNGTLPQAHQDILQKTFSNLEFETGKADIKPSSFPHLDELAGLLKQNPEYKLILSGHTDNVGEALLNYRLSTQRAESVKKYLVGKGIQDGRIEATGYGATKPIASNGSPEGRQKNRRVELQLVR